MPFDVRTLTKGSLPGYVRTVFVLSVHQTCAYNSEKSMMTKDSRIFLRISSGRREMYRQAAAEEGMQLSEWIRRLADRRVVEVVAENGKRELVRA